MVKRTDTAIKKCIAPLPGGSSTLTDDENEVRRKMKFELVMGRDDPEPKLPVNQK